MMGKNLLKVGVLTATMAGILSLTGCGTVATMSQEEITAASIQASTYDKSHSFAWNITKVMGLEHNFKDAYLDETEYNQAQTNSKIEWYVGGTLLTGNPFDLGAMLFLFTPSTTNIIENPVYLGYFPKDKATDERTAFTAFERQVLDAYEAAAAEMGFKKTDYKLALSFERPETSGSITVKMMLGSGKTLKLAHEANIPEWISSQKEASWAVGASPASPLGMDTLRVLDGGIFESGKSSKLQSELMERVATHLPDHAFMFVPSMLNEKGDRTPAYVTDNKQKYFFVMPKSAQPK